APTRESGVATGTLCCASCTDATGFCEGCCWCGGTGACSPLASCIGGCCVTRVCYRSCVRVCCPRTTAAADRAPATITCGEVLCCCSDCCRADGCTCA